MTIGVQATSGANHSTRRVKISGLPEAKLWLEAGNQLWVVSWTKKKTGVKRYTWEPRIESVNLSYFVDI